MPWVTLAAVGALVALAVAVALMPARREAPKILGVRPSPSPRAQSVPDAGEGQGQESAPLLAVQAPAPPGAQSTSKGVSALLGRGRSGSGGVLDVGLTLTEVATLLRAGSSTPQAWQRALERRGISAGTAPSADGVPPALRALAELPPPRLLQLRPPGRGGPSSGPPWRWYSAQERQRILLARNGAPGAIAACRLTAELGAPLAQVLDAVAGSVADAARAEEARRTALAGPRSTARLLAALPLAGLALGSLIGAKPSRFLLDGGLGSAIGCAGILLMLTGHLLTRRMLKAATAASGQVDEALLLDLTAAALDSGASLPHALMALGTASREEGFTITGRALLLGAPWGEAWQASKDPPWVERHSLLASCLQPGWEDGAAPAGLLSSAATLLRQGRQARHEQAAQALAVRLVIPLGLCHLPAFVALGIVPIIASIGGSLLTSM